MIILFRRQSGATAKSTTPFLKALYCKETYSTDRKRGSSHLRLIHADTDTIARDAWLRHLKEGTANTILVADADLFVRQAVNGKVLPELPEYEVASAELAFPVVIGSHLVDKDSPVFPAVTSQVALPVAIDVEPPDHPAALNWFLPDFYRFAL